MIISKNRRFLLTSLILSLLILIVTICRFFSGNPAPFEDEPWKVKGSPSNPVFIVGFSDFRCPHCYDLKHVLDTLLSEFPNELKLIHKHYPIFDYPSPSSKLAEASECAADQGKFWEYYDTLFEKNEDWLSEENHRNNISVLVGYAKILKLDQNMFRTCLETNQKKEIWMKNKKEGKDYLVSGVPAMFLNGRKFLPDHDIESLRSAIKVEINRLKKDEKN